jgi:hypothetical protein
MALRSLPQSPDAFIFTRTWPYPGFRDVQFLYLDPLFAG